MIRILFIALFTLSTAQAESLRVLSWNVFMLPKPLKNSQQGLRSKEIARKLQGLEHDVFVFQEAFTGKFRSRVRKALKKTHPHTHYLKRRSFFSLFGSGLYVVSKYPFEVLDHVYFRTCNGSDCFATKGALLIRIEHPSGKKVQLMTTHLQSKRHAGDTRRIQLETLKPLLDQNRSAGEGQVLLGDLNIDVTEAEFQWGLELLGMKSFELLGPIQKTTSLVNPCFETGTNPKWVDHVWYRNLPQQNSYALEVKPLEFERKGNACPLSDHQAVEAEIIF